MSSASPPEINRSFENTHIIYVHGICKHAAGFSDAWWASLKQYLPDLLDANRHEVLWSDLIEPGAAEPELARARRSLEESLSLSRPGPVSGKLAVAAQIKDILADRASRQFLAASIKSTAQGSAATLSIHPSLASASPQALFNLPGIECVDDFVDYLVDNNIRNQVISRFNQILLPLAQQAGVVVNVISHSWGTVVAYEALRGLDTASIADGVVANLFTVGSALSIALVKRMLLPLAIDGARPRLVRTWINLNAEFDIVGGHLQGNPFQVDAEFLELPPVGCSTLIPNPVCAHSSYFNGANQAVNQDIFAHYIQTPSATIAPSITNLGEDEMARRKITPPPRQPDLGQPPAASTPASPPAAGQGRLIQFDPRAPLAHAAAVQAHVSRWRASWAATAPASRHFPPRIQTYPAERISLDSRLASATHLPA
jgi:hypothetical protein